jgi:hypothetical protein
MAGRIDDGHATFFTFSEAPTVKFWEKSVTPPGMDAGGANDTTTMHNTRYRTMAPKKLVTMSDSTFTAAYDPAVYSEIVSMLGVNQSIVIQFPDLSKVTFWGWLDKFTPNEAVEGAQPEASCTIVCSNQNSSGVETAPAYSAS